jgi:hypothetical protein
MSELQFSAADGKWHAAFAFGLGRNAIVMGACDKSGDS